jgi:glutamine cyclotransferase
MKKSLYILLLSGLAACNSDDNGSKPDTGNSPDAPKSISYSIVDTFPHDTASFTEGLLFYKGKLYESTGQKGQSRIMEVDLKTGKAERSVALDSQYFGEGIVILNDTIYQLTYTEKVGFMYSVNDFKKIGQFSFVAPQGWGMTTDGKQIFASDGSSNLYVYEPGTFRLIRTVSITDDNALVSNLNELEYIDGYIYGNKWQSPYILKIDPNTGKAVGKIDFSAITEQIRVKYPYAEFLNGIAYDSATKKMYITGKNWPELYEIQLSN